MLIKKLSVAILAIVVFVVFSLAQNVEKTPVKIKSKPRPAGKECSQDNGTAKLRVTFDKTAKVTNTEILTLSGCDYFDRNAVAAAKRIKFEPATEDGKPITVKKLVVYVFQRY